MARFRTTHFWKALAQKIVGGGVKGIRLVHGLIHTEKLISTGTGSMIAEQGQIG